ncbi:MAG: methyltransferase [Candidatus Woesearchaeota archaeon]
MVEHYFSKHPKSEEKIFEIQVDLDISFKIYSATGLFSKDELDLGTEVLLKHLKIQPFWTVLDYGCGNGVLGIYIKLKYPGITIYATDINERALKITRMNVKKFGFENFEVLKVRKILELENFFDAIYLNPPMAAGFNAIKEMFINAKKMLKPGGVFQIVVRSKKGANSLEKMLYEIFGNVNVSGIKSGFKVLESTKL